jgi:hypothetical protein
MDLEELHKQNCRIATNDDMKIVMLKEVEDFAIALEELSTIVLNMKAKFIEAMSKLKEFIK